MPILHWLTRDADLRTAAQVPFRLLTEEPALSHGQGEDGLLVQGDNLQALKALLPFYAGRVKCIYIDPPYNTKSAVSIHFDDNLKHAQWLGMITPRLMLLREFLSENGTIWVSIDDNEGHYLKVVMDEVFGRKNFINHIAVKMKLAAGASGGGEDKRLKKNIEHLLVYSKNSDSAVGFKKFNDYFVETDLMEMIEEMKSAGKSWKYTSIARGWGKPIAHKVLQTGTGEDLQTIKYTGLQRTTINAVCREEGITEREAYRKYFDCVFSDTNAQTSIRTRVIDHYQYLDNEEVIETQYTPKSGREKGRKVSHYYISPTIRRVIWLKDTAEKRVDSIIMREKLGTYWKGFSLNNLTKEGEVEFANSKKPEALIQRILHIATNPGDLVLDSFLGSGTTAAVAHKMGRRWIGVEMGGHARTHCATRLRKVIDGEQGGISKDVGWQGGGGFRFVTLGPRIYDENGVIAPDVRFADLARHVWFTETRRPLDGAPDTPLLGIVTPPPRVAEDTDEPPAPAPDRAVALLFNGILRDRTPQGGNVLTRATLALIREHLPQGFTGVLTVYATACRLSPATLKQQGVQFRQTPYDLNAGVL